MSDDLELIELDFKAPLRLEQPQKTYTEYVGPHYYQKWTFAWEDKPKRVNIYTNDVISALGGKSYDITDNEFETAKANGYGVIER